MSFTGPNDTLQMFGVTLIGVTPENGRKLLLTLAFIAASFLIGRLLNAGIGQATSRSRWPEDRFWVRQAVKILTALPPGRHDPRRTPCQRSRCLVIAPAMKSAVELATLRSGLSLKCA